MRTGLYIVPYCAWRHATSLLCQRGFVAYSSTDDTRTPRHVQTLGILPSVLAYAFVG